MDREDIIRMAREQGLPETETEGVFRVNTDDLGRMLVAEREACAELILRGTGEPVQTKTLEILRKERELIAAAIRARGGK